MRIDAPRFKVLALAPYHADASRAWDEAPRTVDRSSLDSAMAEMPIRLFLPLDTHLCPAGGVEFHFDSLKALHPDGMAKSNAYLQQLLQAKEFIVNARKQGAGAAHIRQGLPRFPDLPAMEIKPDAPARAVAGTQADNRLDNILNMVAFSAPETRPAALQKSDADQIDSWVQNILEQLFNDPCFRQLESAWRGLKLLLQQGGADPGGTAVAIAAVHAENLARTLEALTPHVINDLPNVILLDLPFDNSPLDLERLHAAAQWAATLMVPLVAWVPAAFFQIKSWRDLTTLPFIAHHLETAAYAKFRKLQTAAEGQWLCLTCNQFLVRYPYGDENRPRHLAFNESSLPWVSPVWALGALIARSAGQNGWPTRFSDRAHFQIEDLALHAQGNLAPAVSEALLNRDRLDQFIRAGITPLAAEGGRDSAFFPKGVNIAGNPLAFQLLFSQVTQFVLWCKDHLDSAIDPVQLQRQLESALVLFGNQSRPPGFARVQVNTGPHDPSSGTRVHIRLTPDPSVLTSQQDIELQLNW